MPGLMRLHDTASEGDDVTPIADEDGVVSEELVQFMRQPQRMDGRCIGQELRHPRIDGFLLLDTQVAEPLLAALGAIVAAS